MRAINVRKSDTIVLYDKIGMYSAPRAHWLLTTFGIENVLILNGSFSKWTLEGKPTEDGEHPSAWQA